MNSRLRTEEPKGYRESKQWADRYNDAIRAALGQVFTDLYIRDATEKEDQSLATDMMMMDAGQKKVGCRVREAATCGPAYRGEFTLRSRRPNGAETEYSKIMRGHGDWIFYGFGNQDSTLESWFLGNLDVFRSWAASQDKTPGKEIGNRDQSSLFRVFRVCDLPPEFVIAKNNPWIRI